MKASHASRLLTTLLEAARPLVAMTWSEAQEKEHHGMRFMFCQCDVRNPCWDPSYSATGWGAHGPGKHWGGGDACRECNLRAAIAAAENKAPSTPVLAAAAAPGAPSGIDAPGCPAKCPITGRPYFMTLEHPDLGMVPTYGGPFDSYTIPHLEGEPNQPWHERQMVCHRYDHDQGGWLMDMVEAVPLRIIHEDLLNALLAAMDEGVPAATEAPGPAPQGWELPEPEMRAAVDAAIDKNIVAWRQVAEAGFTMRPFLFDIAKAVQRAVIERLVAMPLRLTDDDVRSSSATVHQGGEREALAAAVARRVDKDAAGDRADGGASNG